MRTYAMTRSGQVLVAGGRRKTGRALLRLARRIWASRRNRWAPYTREQQLAARALAGDQKNANRMTATALRILADAIDIQPRRP